MEKIFKEFFSRKLDAVQVLGHVTICLSSPCFATSSIAKRMRPVRLLLAGTSLVETWAAGWPQIRAQAATVKLCHYCTGPY
jgi:hypothetical protein